MRFNDSNFLSALSTVLLFETFEYIHSFVFSKMSWIQCLEEPIRGRILILTGLVHKWWNYLSPIFFILEDRLLSL